MSSARKPLVSIVTPVYNGERFLRDCIESVLAQTYPSWDYTIVNNCSTDNTLAIASEYAARDARIRVHCNTKFVRVIENYNNALAQASPDAKYCKVVAADDKLMPECLEKMVELAEQYPNVGIVGAYGMYGHARPTIAWTGIPYPVNVIPGRDACRAELLGAPYVFGTPTSILFRADLVRSRARFFNESNLQADVEACLEFLEKSDFGFVHQVLTYQGVREGSLSSFSERIRTNLPWILLSLLRYGPKYLTAEELDRRMAEHLDHYYEYLGEQLFKNRGKEFWSYHKAKLAEAGYPLSWPRLLKSSAGYVLDRSLNPKRTIEGIWRKL